MSNTFQWNENLAIETPEVSYRLSNEMMPGYIYKLTLLIDLDIFRSGEVYIGKHNGTKPFYFSGGTLIARIIQKHGKEVFKREILSKDIDNEDLLMYLERYYIGLYKCNRSKHQNGLNLTDGGDGTDGFYWGKEKAAKMTEALKRDYSTGKRRPAREKPVYQYDLTTGSLIGTHSNCVEAARAINGSASSIARCAKGKHYSVKGFGWYYEKIESYKDKPTTQVYQYSRSGDLIKKHNSLDDALIVMGLSKSTGRKRLSKLNKECSEFIWRQSDCSARFINGVFYDPYRKTVGQYDLSGNLIAKFESVTAAARGTGMSMSLISKVCTNGQNFAGGFVFKFLLQQSTS